MSPSSTSMLPWLSKACRSFTSLRARHVTGTHLLRIDDYSVADRMVGQDESIESRTFSVAGHKWRLRFFPNGYDHKYAAGYKYVPRETTAVELKLVKRRSDDDDVVASYALSILDCHGEPAITYGIGPERFNKDSSYKHLVGVLVTPEERQAALRIMAEGGDSLAIRCDITVTRIDKESSLKYYLRKFLD